MYNRNEYYTQFASSVKAKFRNRSSPTFFLDNRNLLYKYFNGMARAALCTALL